MPNPYHPPPTKRRSAPSLPPDVSFDDIHFHQPVHREDMQRWKQLKQVYPDQFNQHPPARRPASNMSQEDHLANLLTQDLTQEEEEEEVSEQQPPLTPRSDEDYDSEEEEEEELTLANSGCMT